MDRDVEYLINHVFLPPKLPQRDDSGHDKSRLFAQLVHNALLMFAEQSPDPECWQALSRMTCVMLEENADGIVPNEMLKSSLVAMKPQGKYPEVMVVWCRVLVYGLTLSVHSIEIHRVAHGAFCHQRPRVLFHVLVLHIRAQNAGVIVRRYNRQYTFEAFELSPTTKAVMGTEGRLRRCFPGPAVIVNQDLVFNSKFREAIVQCISELSLQVLQEACPVTVKADHKVVEVRDSIHPIFVTELLMGILRGVGEPCDDVSRIWKRTRDDVLWHNALLPWRRSPRWLLLRVALQTSLVVKIGDEEVHTRYKSFMVYFMAQILEHALRTSVPSHLLFVMGAKISRRILKLGDCVESTSPWLQYVHGELSSLQQELKQRWENVEHDPNNLEYGQNPNPWQVFSQHATYLSLENSMKYIENIISRKPQNSMIRLPLAQCDDRIKQSSSVLPSGDSLQLLSHLSSRTWLADLEHWVENHLDGWVADNIHSKHSPLDLEATITAYQRAAIRMYENDPEHFSVMVLTVMDMWLALDKCSISHEPLLKKYDSGFPKSLFDCLLLPKNNQMRRLHVIESYLTSRREEAIPGYPSIFTDATSWNCFSIQYFEQSLSHQDLKREIELVGTNSRRSKKIELITLKAEYLSLLQQSNSKSCEFAPVLRGKRGRKTEVKEHVSNCSKCLLKSRAEKMKIDIHEWPLPYMENEAKAAVFELNVPSVIHAWRETTYEILADILTPPTMAKGSNKMYTYHGFQGIQCFIRSSARRLQLASPQKEFSRAHYKSQAVSTATEFSICVNNGLHCILWDSDMSLSASEMLGQFDISKKCTTQLPDGPYKVLQYAVNATFHESNEVLARQDKCPESLTLHEYYAFATLRSGHRLQWRNIARELVSRTLNFSHDETCMLVLQAAWQVGPSDGHSTCRDAHKDLEEPEFGLSLLSALDEALSSVGNNWQCAPAVRTFTFLVVRLLSVSPHEMVHTACFQLLQRLRSISLRWSREVAQLMHDNQSDQELKRLTIRALDLALICHASFDVDARHLDVILSSAENVASLTECAIIAHDRYPTSITKLAPTLRADLLRMFRRTHSIEPILRQKVLADPSGLDTTIRHLWATYEPGASWTALEAPMDRWVTTMTLPKGSHSPMSVDFNTLDGGLLVGGLPLSRLPEKYENHPTYRRLFAQKVLDVVPSELIGMSFATRRAIHGQHIHFAIYNEELIIRTSKEDQVLELIPHYSLNGDFPRAFIEEFVHWLNIGLGVIEWRSLKDPWVSSPLNWRTCAEKVKLCSLVQGSFKLIDIRSPTATAIAKVLGPIEQATHIHIMLNSVANILEIHLPRINLDFFMISNSLESKQFRGMEVDQNQNFGAFSGLVNKLVLRETSGRSRIVIVPEGMVGYEQHNDHVKVHVCTESKERVSYHQFQVDSQLGRLVDNGSLRSRLFRVYLHALTSHCSPDQLTGRTGTEEALHSLSLSSTQSFLTLTKADIDQLLAISKLTPKRVYYPIHLKVMQDIQWAGMSPLSQHEGFYQVVSAIIQKAQSLKLFQDSDKLLDDLCPRKHNELYRRAAFRNSSFRSNGFGAEDFSTEKDSSYDARDLLKNTRDEMQVCKITKMVHTSSRNTKACEMLLEVMESWRKPILGPDNELLLGFGAQWLENPDDILPTYWCGIHRALLNTRPEDRFKIMVFMSTLSYALKSNPELIQTLLALATVPELRKIRIPQFAKFDLADGYEPDRRDLRKLIANFTHEFRHCPESQVPREKGETKKFAEDRRLDKYNNAIEARINVVVEILINQWPTPDPDVPSGNDLVAYIKLREATPDIRALFRSCYANREFRCYVGKIQETIKSYVEVEDPPLRHIILPREIYQNPCTHLTFDNLLLRTAPTICQSQRGFQELNSMVRSTASTAKNSTQDQCSNVSQASNNSLPGKLPELLQNLSEMAAGGYEESYVKDLQRSLDVFGQANSLSIVSPEQVQSQLQEYCGRMRLYAIRLYRIIYFHLLLPRTIGEEISQIASMSPRLSPSIILSRLARGLSIALDPNWKMAIINYGLTLTELQRADRLLACSGNKIELLAELANPGHLEWDPVEYPDWLLLELENNILIRQEQAQIAKQMISPSSGSNSIMQLNMGLGKSSVIVPIVAAALADGTKLSRVVVLKSLSTQMFQLLLNKLGGMINRPVYFMPISRSLQLGIKEVLQIRKMYEVCMRAGGILLVQPEHMLSFELLGLDRVLADYAREGHSNQVNHTRDIADDALVEVTPGIVMIDTQRWLLEHARDILDESDEILSVRFELIYTMGSQRATEFSPDRWTIIEHVLDILRKLAQEVASVFPNGLEVLPAKFGTFPRIRILQEVAGAELLSRVAHEICEAGLPGVSVWNLPQKARAILFKFLTDPTIKEAETYPLQDSALGIDAMQKSLLLLRGLFAGGIMHFAFSQKRWRVNYGLDLSRTNLAVPYHAKDSPAARAEFSHPDTAIVLTCLSYYYGGLSDNQIRASFKELFQSDTPQECYEEWTKDIAELPSAFRQLSGVNLSNAKQCARGLFPFLRFSKQAIDFYMTYLVFPKEMKEFTHKLSSSGWEIGRDKAHPITGFSGTNDSRYVLPVPVKQYDLPQQLHTNAAVLDCLLRPENTVDSRFTHGLEVLDGGVLLQMAVESSPSIRVILDVGAQVLELRNFDVARKWLSLVSPSDAQAVIYFDDNNEVCVLSRTGLQEPLMVSPFSKQMDLCLVYLDEAHTRGTDLRMPADYRAIVTLGPDLTKDRLAQACMRLRKLGKGQSVVFCGSVEVQLKIIQANGKSAGDLIEVADVLSWCIQNTWKNTKKSIPLWAAQGVRHYRRRAACHATTGLPKYPERILEQEAQTLQERYGFGSHNPEDLVVFQSSSEDHVGPFRPQLMAIRLKCQEFGLSSFGGSILHEEQERELQPENEREQQVERPPPLYSMPHHIHPHVLDFVAEGMLNRFSPAFQPAFKTFVKTSAGEFFETGAWSESLLVTSDFAQTVIMNNPSELMDQYLRPVHWLLSGRFGKKISCVIISPAEANYLLPVIRKYEKVTLHVYAPRLSLSNKSLEDLAFCAIPPVPENWAVPSLAPQINLFAGQLYLRNVTEYLHLTRFLGLCSQAPEGDQIRVACDGFVNPADRAFLDSAMVKICNFNSSPVSFLRVLMSLRRKGMSFSGSHLGRILNGELLQDQHFVLLPGSAEAGLDSLYIRAGENLDGDDSMAGADLMDIDHFEDVDVDGSVVFYDANEGEVANQQDPGDSSGHNKKELCVELFEVESSGEIEEEL